MPTTLRRAPLRVAALALALTTAVACGDPGLHEGQPPTYDTRSPARPATLHPPAAAPAPPHRPMTGLEGNPHPYDRGLDLDDAGDRSPDIRSEPPLDAAPLADASAPDLGAVGDDAAVQDTSPTTDSGVSGSCDPEAPPLMGAATDASEPRFVDQTNAVDGGDLEGIDLSFGGVALADLDRDGHLDIAYAGPGGDLQLLMGCGGGRFAPRAPLDGARLESVRSVVHVDIDNDGDADLIAATGSGTSLLENRGDGSFDDASLDWHLASAGGRSAVALADFDNDGWLDLYEAAYERRINRLSRNLGDRFEPLAETPGNAPSPGMTFGVTWSDVDQDGLVDLHVVNDYGMLFTPNQLFMNRGPDALDPGAWQFVEVGAVTGFGVAVFGMGTTFGDFDNDGDLDAYTANVTNNLLHVVEQASSGRCHPEAPGFCAVDRAGDYGVTSGHLVVPGDPAPWPDFDAEGEDPVSAAFGAFCDLYCEPESGAWALSTWSPLFFDADHNGWLDLFVGNGWILTRDLPIALHEPNYLFLNDGVGFERAAPGVFPTTTATTRGAATGDLDGDGDLDLVWIDNGHVGAARLRVLENRVAAGHWLQVELTGTISNRDAVGARVTAHVDGLILTRELSAGQGFASDGQRVAHFGLGAHEVVDHVTVRWPNGRLDTWTDVPADRVLYLTESAE